MLSPGVALELFNVFDAGMVSYGELPEARGFL
jgi:hypothetical protein